MMAPRPQATPLWHGMCGFAFASEHESLPLVLHQVVDGMVDGMLTAWVESEVLRAEGDSTDETLGVRRQAHKAGIGLDYSLASYS